MKVKRKKVPKEWDCYDCTEKKVGVRKGEENEEAGSGKRKAVSLIDSFEVIHKIHRSLFMRQDLRKMF